VIPDLKTSDVQPKGPPAKVQCDPFHQQLVLREVRVAGVARFAVAWTTPKPVDALLRQERVAELASDEAAEGFLVHVAAGVCLVQRLAPLFIPEGEAVDVQLNRLPETVHPGNTLDHERTRDQSVAGVALLSFAWTDPPSRDAV
jgi:hypothetical protein